MGQILKFLRKMFSIVSIVKVHINSLKHDIRGPLDCMGNSQFKAIELLPAVASYSYSMPGKCPCNRAKMRLQARVLRLEFSKSGIF